jgi:hypothetical protein
MNKAARIFFNPDFADAYLFFTEMESEIYGSVFPQFNRITGKGSAFRGGGGSQVLLVYRLPDDRTAQTPCEEIGFPGSLRIQDGRCALFFSADRAGRSRAAGAEGLDLRGYCFTKENPHFQGYMGLVHQIPLFFLRFFYFH